MKRILQVLCLALATLGLSNCSTYVEDTGYVSARSGYVYRSAPRHHHAPNYGSSRYHHDRSISYRSGSHRDYNRNVSYRSNSSRDHGRYHRDHDRSRSSRYDGRRSSYRSSTVDTRVRTGVRL